MDLLTLPPLYTTLLLLLLVTSSAAKTAENVVVASCPPSAASCEFHFRVDYNITMMSWIMAPDTGDPDVMLPVVVAADGNFYSKRRDCSGQDPLQEEDFETFLSGDGSYKKILAINSRFPGTPIVVYKGQTVSVFVTNEMENEVITIHWHGQKQLGTPWMDGAGSVSQCPITPRQTFQYKFEADPVGTHWYHGHIGHQRTLGMVGHLTVLDRSPEEENQQRGDDPIPTIDGQFHLMFSEWTEKATDEYSESLNAGYGFSGGFETETCQQPLMMADGSFANSVPFESILINGKGHRYNKTTGQPQTPTLPLEVFTIQQGGRFRFRLVNAGLQMPFSVSIDEHVLHVITSDGSPVRTTSVNNLIVAAGERFDFWVQADDPTAAGNYWIRVVTLGHKGPGELADEGLAILHYDHVPQVRPTTTARDCTLQACVNLNSPYRYHHPSTNIKCVPLMALRMPVPEPTLKQTDGTGFTELMLALDTGLKSTINGRVHQINAVPPQIYPGSQRDVMCSEETCSGDDICKCTHEVQVEKGHVVQATFYAHKVAAAPGGSSHPMHIHGHTFQVLKVGWPMYNASTMVGNSPDITCGPTTGVCKHPRWVDPSWAGGNVPGLLTEGAITKDTVNVPAGGYVVIRFTADNPGFWLLHCHMDLHSEMGMTLVLKVGDVSDMAPVPRGFPVCGDFDWDNAEFHERITNPQPQRKVKAQAESELCMVAVPMSHQRYQIATAMLGTLLSVAVLAMFVVTYKTCTRRTRYRKGLMVEVPGSFLPSQETTPLLS